MVLAELGINFLDMKNDSRFSFAEQVNKSIIVMKDERGVAVASAGGLEHKGDRLHFSSASAAELGRRYAWKWLLLTGRLSTSMRILVGDLLDPPFLGSGAN